MFGDEPGFHGFAVANHLAAENVLRGSKGPFMGC